MKTFVNDIGYLVYAMKESENDPDYDSFTEFVKTKPEPIEGHEWYLKYPEIEWVSVELPPEDISEDEAFRIMLGEEE